MSLLAYQHFGPGDWVWPAIAHKMLSRSVERGDMRRGETRTEARGAAHLYDALMDAGIELLVELTGTKTLPLGRVIAEQDGMRYVMARHETPVPPRRPGILRGLRRAGRDADCPRPRRHERDARTQGHRRGLRPNRAHLVGRRSR